MALKGRKGFGLRLSDINSQMRIIEDGFAKLFTALQKQRVSALSSETWADFVLKDLKKVPNSENRKVVLERLDAAYVFACTLWEFMKNESYDFHKHRTEIVDAQQLYYLCDPDMHFLTCENKLKKRIGKSTQSARVLLYEESRNRILSGEPLITETGPT